MLRTVIDRRKRKPQIYRLRVGAYDTNLLPTGMYLGIDDQGRESIFGEPNLTIYKKE